VVEDHARTLTVHAQEDDMKHVVVGLTICTLLLGAADAVAGVNCEQVRRYAATGRSPDDIAESMIVDVDEVKKCLGTGTKDAAPTPAPTAPQKQ
jgi:hypothetical protein